jgi:hypothetical protein
MKNQNHVQNFWFVAQKLLIVRSQLQSLRFGWWKYKLTIFMPATLNSGLEIAWFFALSFSLAEVTRACNLAKRQGTCPSCLISLLTSSRTKQDPHIWQTIYSIKILFAHVCCAVGVNQPTRAPWRLKFILNCF